MNINQQNEKAWNQQAKNNTPYSQAVSSDVIQKARTGDWAITVTTNKIVPRNWFPESLSGLNILCLASGGGQQAPILAAAGADVTVVDISNGQLEKDRMVAERDGIKLNIKQGNMTDLADFDEAFFDMVINPVSNLFIEDLTPFWSEIYRVLKKGGTLIIGFTNPLLFIFDSEEDMKGNLVVKNTIPYSTIDGMNEKSVKTFLKSSSTIEFGHTLESQIQGQFDAGFIMNGFYEDDFNGRRPLDQYIPSFIATRSIKM